MAEKLQPAIEKSPDFPKKAGYVEVRPRDHLCEVCIRLDYAEIPKASAWYTIDFCHWKGWPHHTTFRNLQQAVHAGCGHCAIFRQTLVNAYIERTGWSEDRIVQYHLLRDANRGGEFFLGRDAAPRPNYERLCDHRSRDQSEFSLSF